jgi:hypothetical protein
MGLPVSGRSSPSTMGRQYSLAAPPQSCDCKVLVNGSLVAENRSLIGHEPTSRGNISTAAPFWLGLRMTAMTGLLPGNKSSHKVVGPRRRILCRTLLDIGAA